MENELQIYEEERPLKVSDVMGQVALIQQIMKEAMKKGEHYGVIPGCGDKPALLKPGAEKLSMTFRMAPKFEGDKEPIDLGNGHKEYVIKCSLYSIMTGRFLGQGLGSCSTMETKYRFRTGPVEFTGNPVPKGYWDIRQADPKKALEIIGGKGFTTKKNPDTGAWEIARQGERIEFDNPADHYNTVLKMAKKRALVDAVLTSTAASDIFTQDIEELVDNGVIESEKKESDKPPLQEPQKKSEGKPEDIISEPQRKRFYATAKSTGASDEQIKEWLMKEYSLKHTNDIPKSQYDEICNRVKDELSQPGSEG